MSGNTRTGILDGIPTPESNAEDLSTRPRLGRVFVRASMPDLLACCYLNRQLRLPHAIQINRPARDISAAVNNAHCVNGIRCKLIAPPHIAL